MKTAVSIPDRVFDSSERLSKRLGISRSELYAKALETFLNSHSRVGLKEELDAVYGTETSDLDPVLMAMQVVSLPREDW
jgi:metal-responsive CopG/Arc/MetJ family transcriptional regulator